MSSHGDIGFGPGYYIFVSVFIMAAVCGVWMMIDTLRAKRRQQKTQHHIPREPLSVYALAGGLYAALLLLVFVLSLAGATQTFAMAVVVATPFMLGAELAYLLRVVYPKPPKER
jgi:L-asparagine transporter-like permease